MLPPVCAAPRRERREREEREAREREERERELQLANFATGYCQMQCG